MTKHNLDRGINVIKPLHRFASYFALVSPYDMSKGLNCTLYKLYSIFLTLLVICASGASVYYATRTEEYLTTHFLYGTSYVATTALVTSSMISTSLNVENCKEMLLLFDAVDKCLKSNSKSDKRSKKLWIALFLTHSLLICLAGYDSHNSITAQGMYHYYCSVMILIEIYFTMITVLLVYNYCFSLKLRFGRLNNHLAEIARVRVLRQDFNSYLNGNKDKRVEMAVSLRRAFTQMSRITDLLNTMFGWQILFFFGTIAAGLLDTVNYEILNLTGNATKGSTGSGRLLHVLWTTAIMAMGVVVAVTCDLTTREARRTAAVCYSLLLDVPAGSNNAQDRVLREELMLLAEQATYQSPRFSAAGFFSVDYTLLFGLLGTVTSYVIVLIQINT